MNQQQHRVRAVSATNGDPLLDTTQSDIARFLNRSGGCEIGIYTPAEQYACCKKQTNTFREIATHNGETLDYGRTLTQFDVLTVPIFLRSWRRSTATWNRIVSG